MSWTVVAWLAAAWCTATSVAAEAVPIFVSGQDRPYSVLSADEPEVVTVRGPGELRLITRARFRPADDDGQRYSLRLRVDGGEEQTVTFDAVGRSRTAMFRDGTLGTPGRLMDHRIPLRRGYHNIEVRAAEGEPQIFFRHLFKKTKEPRRQWVALAPVGESRPVDLVIREGVITYYRNPAGRPFELEVIGPTEMRIFTRVENTPEMRGRIHYRLQILQNGAVVNTFQLNSRRSDVTVYRFEDELVPGRAAEIVVPVPAGRHRFEVLPLDPDKSTLLGRFMLPREDLALTVED
ncbi:MAG: hypothetical protein AAGE94_13190 [Acidobacteriota bacterium]